MLTILLSFQVKSNPEIRYHKIQYTSSSVKLLEWNITDTNGVSFVEEKIDQLGRVKELRFYNSFHQLQWAGSGYYGGPVIKYYYQDNQITETFFKNEFEFANDFRRSEVPYKHIYTLNDSNQITNIKFMYNIEFEWEKQNIDSVIRHLKFYSNINDEDSDLKNVFGYSYSFAKMNGVSPQKVK